MFESFLSRILRPSIARRRDDDLKFIDQAIEKLMDANPENPNVHSEPASEPVTVESATDDAAHETLNTSNRANAVLNLLTRMSTTAGLSDADFDTALNSKDLSDTDREQFTALNVLFNKFRKATESIGVVFDKEGNSSTVTRGQELSNVLTSVYRGAAAPFFLMLDVSDDELVSFTGVSVSGIIIKDIKFIGPELGFELTAVCENGRVYNDFINKFFTPIKSINNIIAYNTDTTTVDTLRCLKWLGEFGFTKLPDSVLYILYLNLRNSTSQKYAKTLAAFADNPMNSMPVPPASPAQVSTDE